MKRVMYETPEMEFMNLVVEQGFAASDVVKEGSNEEYEEDNGGDPIW